MINSGQLRRFAVTIVLSMLVYAGAADNGVESEYYEQTGMRVLPDFDSLIPVSTNVIANFEIGSRLKDNDFAFRYRSYIEVNNSGEYTFHTRSDDGSKVYIDGTEVVNNDGLHAARWRSGSKTLAAGRHEIVVTFFERGGREVLQVQYEGPGVSRQDIPDGVLFLERSGGHGGVPGGILREYWTGISGAKVTNLTGNPAYPDSPTGTDTLSEFEAVDWNNPSDSDTWANNYGQRLRGYIFAPKDGEYTLWIAGDDNCELWLSTDGDAANKTKIAEVPGWTRLREWNRYSGQQSAPITLEAGKIYYVEVLHKERSGGDRCSVGWAKPGEATAVPSEIVPGAVLAPWTDGALPPQAPDADGDQMPDWWEWGCFGVISEPPDADYDGDGVDNLTEYLRGMDPTKGFVADTEGLVNLVVYTVLK